MWTTLQSLTAEIGALICCDTKLLVAFPDHGPLTGFLIYNDECDLCFSSGNHIGEFQADAFVGQRLHTETAGLVFTKSSGV
jgi:hypothetical protein